MEYLSKSIKYKIYNYIWGIKNKETEIDSIDNYIKRMEPIVKSKKKV